MSETSTLISCTDKITRAELAKLPALRQQQPTSRSRMQRSWKPWSKTLSHGHIGVVGEEFAVSMDAMENVRRPRSGGRL
jgi:hypothetical protein